MAQGEFILPEQMKYNGVPGGRFPPGCEDTSAAVRVGVEALKILIQQDRAAG